MILVITCIELKSPLKFFQLSIDAMQIMRELKTASCIGFKKTGFWTKHYTMTLWRNEVEMKQFARNGHHLKVMHKAGHIAKSIKTLTVVADDFLDWREAKQLLQEQNKVIVY